MVHPARPVAAPVVTVPHVQAVLTLNVITRCAVVPSLTARGVVRGAIQYRNWPGPGQNMRRGKT